MARRNPARGTKGYPRVPTQSNIQGDLIIRAQLPLKQWPLTELILRYDSEKRGPGPKFVSHLWNGQNGGAGAGHYHRGARDAIQDFNERLAYLWGVVGNDSAVKFPG